MSNNNEGKHPGGTLVEALPRRAEGLWAAREYRYLVEGAVEGEEQSLILTDLDREARSLAAELQRVAARGDRVILLFPAGLEFLNALFGCLAAGLVAVPVATQRPNSPSLQLEAIVESSGAALLLSSAKNLAL